MEDETDILPADKHESFLQDDRIIFLCFVSRHGQSTQNNKFAISLKYLLENVKNEVNFFVYS